VEKERSRIAQDMHDELGARLTEIMLVSDRAQEMKNEGDGEKIGSFLGKISTLARSVVGNLDTLVWTVNPRNDSVDKLATYICEYAQSFLEASTIQCRFDVPHDLPHSALSSEVRHNVLLTVKEALNNAVKHSQATEILLRLQMKEDGLIIAIEDNGRGFEPAAASGNGLQNMEKRMRNMGGRFELTGGPGKGTRIQLEIPIKTGTGRLIA
jgi:signal transduction histidine kinase